MSDRCRADPSERIVRFEAPRLNAFNFLPDALDAGGIASRRIEPPGKAYGPAGAGDAHTSADVDVGHFG
jgi:hypothetical protein